MSPAAHPAPQPPGITLARLLARALKKHGDMLPRLLYAAVGLCLLGTRPEHVPTRPVAAATVAAHAPDAPRACASSAIAGTPVDFAIPRNSR